MVLAKYSPNIEKLHLKKKSENAKLKSLPLMAPLWRPSWLVTQLVIIQKKLKRMRLVLLARKNQLMRFVNLLSKKVV